MSMSNNDKVMVAINLGNIDESYAELPSESREAMVSRVLSSAFDMRRIISDVRSATQSVTRPEDMLTARLDDIGIAVALAETAAVSLAFVERFGGRALMHDAYERIKANNPIRVGERPINPPSLAASAVGATAALIIPEALTKGTAS